MKHEAIRKIESAFWAAVVFIAIACIVSAYYKYPIVADIGTVILLVMGAWYFFLWPPKHRQ